MRFGYVWFSELIDKNWKVLNSVKLCEIPWNLMKFVRICNEIWKNRVTLVWFLKRAYEKTGGYGRGPPRGLKKIWTSSNWKRQRFLSQSDNLEIKLGWADLWCCGVRWFEQNWKIMHFERNKMKNVEKSTTWRDIFMGTWTPNYFCRFIFRYFPVVILRIFASAVFFDGVALSFF